MRMLIVLFCIVRISKNNVCGCTDFVSMEYNLRNT